MKLEGVPVLCNGHINPGLATGDTDISFDFSKKVIEDFQKDKAENLVAAKQTVGVEYTAPDGGWGWVIAIAAFATWFLVGLTAYNFGMLYSEFLLEMGTSTTFISWIYCLGLVISSIISAFVDPLVVAFGWRKVAVVMGAIYSFALIVSAFATSSIFLLFSSLVAGSMVDTLYNIVSSIIPHYFIRWRDLVNTIMVLGTSVNLLVVPYLLVYLHAEYGFRVFSCVNIFHVKAAAMAVLGSGMSFASAAFIPVIVDIFGLPLVLPVLCVTGIFEAIGFLTIGPITGAVRDLSGSYTFSLYVSSACIFSFSFLPCMCLWAVNAYNQRQQHKLLQEKASGKSKEEIYH
ncbi:monocarboxylate transporter 9-like isoform X2 [Scylla paramamosain]|uniref:monocarboxylate transporter 9-like isoform X2 n=1 Tax=Scylla paramamosain TaxID=85552 RepID=UPI003083D671